MVSFVTAADKLVSVLLLLQRAKLKLVIHSNYSCSFSRVTIHLHNPPSKQESLIIKLNRPLTLPSAPDTCHNRDRIGCSRYNDRQTTFHPLKSCQITFIVNVVILVDLEHHAIS